MSRSAPRTATGGLLLLAGAGALLVRLARTQGPELRVTRADGTALPDTTGAPGGLPSRARSAPRVRGAAHVAPPSWEPPLLSALAGWEPAPPATTAGRVLARMWAAPLSLAGLLAGATGGTSPHLHDGVLLFRGAGGLPGWFFARKGYSAFALGHVVVAKAPDPSPPLLAHELVHVRQAERFGLLLGPCYLVLNAVYGYARNPFERAARRAQRRALGVPDGR